MGESSLHAPTCADLVAEARRRWPRVEFDAEALEVALATQEWAERAGAVDWCLTQECLRGTPSALAELDRVLDRARPALRRCVGDEEVDDCLQLTRMRLLVATGGGAPRLAEYSGKGTLVSWVRTVAVRLALNERKTTARRAQLAPHQDDPVLAGDGLGLDPALALARERHRADFERALGEAWAALSSELRLALRMSVLDRQSIDRIAAVLGTHRATAARKLERGRLELLERTRGTLASTLALPREELDSLLRAVGDGLELSLRPILLRSGGPTG